MKKSATLENEILDIQAEANLNFGIADDILRYCAVEERSPRFDEIAFLKGRCGWDDAEVTRQTNRMRSVCRHQAIAGNQSQRAAAVAERERCAKLIETEVPNIQCEIEKLQDKVAAIERSAARSTQKCEQIDGSMNELRSVNLLRPDIASEYELRLQNISEEFEAIGELNVEIDFRENLLGSIPEDFNARQRFFERVKSSFPDCVRPNPHRLGSLEFVEPAWIERKKILFAELSEMKDRQELLVSARDAAIAEANKLLDFYAQ